MLKLPAEASLPFPGHLAKCSGVPVEMAAFSLTCPEFCAGWRLLRPLKGLAV